MTHPCPAPDCQQQEVEDDKVSCRMHWFDLPLTIRKKIWDGQRQGTLSDAHAAAMAEATDYLRGLKPVQDL